ncbi:MAG TPA: uroporphyrinogen-III C-methyltransferase [Solirubrobacteraceae bacterium]|nr:uroporphyrinogen-III C-methyltransferase [Solirubrobacteraceae bacterium]
MRRRWRLPAPEEQPAGGTRGDPGRGAQRSAEEATRPGAAADGAGSGGSAGSVHLVGAGPGDPGLLTARALALIAAADTILYDRLIPASALDGARPDAELLFVGKQGGGESVSQEQTEELLIARARAGRTVVRLKGGDPFVFGRGGEEALALRAAGIAYEIVPGVTAGIAAPAYAGIPVTHRDLASAVALITGHEDPNKDETSIEWPALAAFPGTLVFYMGVRRLPAIASSLLAAGRSPEEPVAVVECGTLPDQRCVLGTLTTIAELAGAAQVRAPSITVVGPVAALAGELSWLPPRPQTGHTVAVTRARPQASSLARRLESLGARAVQAPAIRTRPLPGGAPDLAPYDLVCLTSPAGVCALFERLHASGLDARALAGVRVAAIGSGTAAALSDRGIAADVVPEHAVAEGLLDALADLEPPVRRALLARAREGRDVLPEGLRARGAEVDVLALYETIAESPPAHVLREALAADYITFTSASTVRLFLQSAGYAGAAGDAGRGESPGEPGRAPAGAGAMALFSPHTRIVSIGPITSDALREHGLQPHAEATRHDIDGLVQALLADARARAS